MSQLIIVAHIYAKSDKIDFVKDELLKLIPITRGEEGCIQYNLHQDKEDLAHFLFYENWESRNLWQNHMNSPHLVAYMEATADMVEKFTLNEMNHIG
ncbi:MAG: putative quinol monooxygenase [Cyanobacteria bacterium P01_H01_bin.21]